MATTNGGGATTIAPAPVVSSQPPQPAQAVKVEVRALLELNLTGNDPAVKIDTLNKLAEYFAEKGEGPDAFQQKAEHRRAVEHLDGCHLVLIVLRQELAKAGGPHRNVVYSAIRFLANWCIGSPEHCDALSRFDGIGVILDVMKVFIADGGMGTAAVCCLLNYTSDNDAARLGDFVEGDALEYIIQAMLAHTNNESLQRRALIVLERSCEVSDRSRRERLIKNGALLAVSAAYTAFFLSDAQIRALCSIVMQKLCV